MEPPRSLAVKRLRFRLLEATQLTRQPTITPMGQHRHGDVQVDVQTHFAAQTIQMKEVDAGAETIFLKEKTAKDAKSAKNLFLSGQQGWAYPLSIGSEL